MWMRNVGSDSPEVWGGERRPQAVQAGLGRGSRVREARNELYAMVHACSSCRESGHKYGRRGREYGNGARVPFQAGAARAEDAPLTPESTLG